MWAVLGATWALLLGVGLLMIGNGLQSTLMGVRGSIEGFSTIELSLITSGYFLGFLFGSRLAPEMIRRVGHVRVFAALGSFFSAILVLYPVLTEAWAWMLLRVAVGFCLSGIYVTSESWLNNATSSENRGKLLSAYMVVQTLGIVLAQVLVNVGDPAGFIPFIIPSVLVSLSFAPILLSVQPTPPFETAKAMSFGDLYRASPTGFVGTVILGGVFAALFGMASVWGASAGLTVREISIFIATIFVGALVFQLPMGWASDRVDRRVVILSGAVIGTAAALLGMVSQAFELLLIAAFFYGGMANPLYSLLIAYTNDWLEPEDMASASGRLIALNGMGAVAGPLVTGWFISMLGEAGFWVYLAILMAALAAYVAYRMTVRESVAKRDDDYEATTYAPVLQTATPVALEAAQEWYIENAEADAEAAEAAAAETGTGTNAAA